VASSSSSSLVIPSAATGLQIATNASGLYVMTWNAVSGATSYSIVYSVPAANNMTQSSPVSVTGTSSSSSYKGYSLKACNSAGCSLATLF
jgi:hypothetical protein